MAVPLPLSRPETVVVIVIAGVVVGLATVPANPLAAATEIVVTVPAPPPPPVTNPLACSHVTGVVSVQTRACPSAESKYSCPSAGLAGAAASTWSAKFRSSFPPKFTGP
jgi:hypothetical protein